MGEPERGLTPNGVVARDGDGGGEFIIERDMATERSADEAAARPTNGQRPRRKSWKFRLRTRRDEHQRVVVRNIPPKFHFAANLALITE